MTNAEVIVDYCKRNLVGKVGFDKYMEYNPNFLLSLIDEKFLTDNEIDAMNKIKILIFFQKLKNKAYEKELKVFQSENNHYIGLKGIFLQKAYYPSEHIRLFNDIDILVDDKDGYNFYRMLKRNGYYILRSPDSPIIYQKKLIIDKILIPTGSMFFKYRHHAELEKHVETMNEAVRLDLHGNLFLQKNSPKNKMINNAIVKNIDDFSFKIFAPEDNILFLMFHAIKHIGYVNLAREGLSVNLQHFYDVAQIISNERINWDTFTNCVFSYNYLCPMIALFIKMFNDVFPNLIPNYVIEKIMSISKSLEFHWKIIFDNVIDLPASDLILGNYESVPWLHNYCSKMKKKNIEADYVWAYWAKFYFLIKFKKQRDKLSLK